MRHVFKATRLGWTSECEGIWFDSDFYTEEEARACFHPYQGYTQEGYPYTGYEYAGVKYYEVVYLGEFEDDQMPRNDEEYLSMITGSGDR